MLQQVAKKITLLFLKNRRKNASRVRVSRALSKAHRQMNTLRVETVKLTKRKD